MTCCFPGGRRVAGLLLCFAMAALAGCSEQQPGEAVPPVATGDVAPATDEQPPAGSESDDDRSKPVVDSLPVETTEVPKKTQVPRKVEASKKTKSAVARDTAATPVFKNNATLSGLTLPRLETKSGRPTAQVATATKKPPGAGVGKSVSNVGKPVNKNVTDSATVVVAPDMADGNLDTLEVYSVKLAADMQLTVPGSPGEFIVWIGAPDVEKRFDIGMVTDETRVPAVGQTAQVVPHAPDFEVTPGESQCIKIHPSGSEVRFELSPKETGSFEVSASVKLFDSADCSGASVPKIVDKLTVQVVVNEGKLVEQGLGEMVKVAWEKFLEFWGALVALVLALVLFAVRGKFKKWFGFE